MKEFFRELTPYLTANILTLMLAYAAIAYTRLEKSGRASEGGYLLGIMCLVIGLALYGLYLHGAFDVLTGPSAAMQPHP